MGKKDHKEDENKGTVDKIKNKGKAALDPYAGDETGEPDKPGDKAPPSEAWSGGRTMGGTDEELVGREHPGVVGEGGEELGREERPGREGG